MVIRECVEQLFILYVPLHILVCCMSLRRSAEPFPRLADVSSLETDEVRLLLLTGVRLVIVSLCTRCGRCECDQGVVRGTDESSTYEE